MADGGRVFRVRLFGEWLTEDQARGLVIENEIEDYTHEVPGAAYPHLRLTGRQRVILGGSAGDWREPGDWLVIE